MLGTAIYDNFFKTNYRVQRYRTNLTEQSKQKYEKQSQQHKKGMLTITATTTTTNQNIQEQTNLMGTIKIRF